MCVELPTGPTQTGNRRLSVDELHALLYREIGIAAVAAVLRVNHEARVSRENARPVHPLPAILRGHDLAA